ncbi:SDR family NAD(P)-dependent oxidoreductase [Varunaivibrio sulfuroxidans]|nr:SDR family NAD(P)-dependent oxidoreductase [Varunaivibrio sulfuroxidans]WES30905.1 SDR family NAD(P)-dependent oxidoreductase [Varunaivibrio sulfuroxidans]
MKEPNHILITGASSGIGRALALRYAAPGVRLSLCGRDRTRLDDIAAQCRAKGADVNTAIVDVKSAQSVTAWIEGADRHQPLDLVIANAGISGGSGGKVESAEQARAIFDTNLGGVLNTVFPAVAAMRPRGGGQIAIVASLAGFIAIPGAAAYSASKAAVITWGEALNGQLKADGVCVSVICPGFVASAMTDANPFPMPFLMPAEKAARIIRRALARRPLYIVFPWQTALLTRVLRLLPAPFRGALFNRAPKKPPR